MVFDVEGLSGAEAVLQPDLYLLQIAEHEDVNLTRLKMIRLGIDAQIRPQVVISHLGHRAEQVTHAVSFRLITMYSDPQKLHP